MTNYLQNVETSLANAVKGMKGFHAFLLCLALIGLSYEKTKPNNENDANSIPDDYNGNDEDTVEK